MCCQGCSPVTAFSWVGGILVNLSFIFLISWGTAVFWPVGLGLACIYTGLLFGAAACLRQRKAPSTSIDIVLLLSVIGVGVCGTILAYNTVGCARPLPASSNSGPDSWIFPADAVGASDEIKDWATQSRWDYSLSSRATYAQGAGGALFFKGRNASETDEQLYVSAGGATPRRATPALRNPSQLVMLLQEQHVCCTGWAPEVGSGSTRVFCGETAAAGAMSAVATSDAPAVASSSSGGNPSSTAAASPNNPTSLLASADGSLWFKADAPFGSSGNAGVVYRATPPYTTATLISKPANAAFPAPPPPAAPGPAGGSGSGTTTTECDSDEGFRMLAIALLCLASLPALGTAIFLWQKHKADAPSMAFAAFGATSALAINIYAIIEPAGTNAVDVIQWWFATYGGVWLVVFASLKLAQRSDETTIAWAVNAGCIAYFAAVHALTEVPVTSSALSWVLYNLLVTIPLLVLSVLVAGVAAAVPLLLSSAALLMDTWKATFELTNLVGDATLQTFLRFVILGVVGVAIAAAGIVYARVQAQVAEQVESLATRLCAPCRRRPKLDWPEGAHSKASPAATAPAPTPHVAA